MDCPSTVKAVRNLSERWPGAVAKLIEDKANGSAVIQMLDCELPGIFPVNPSGGKVARAQAISPLIEAGNVYLPHPDYAPWVNDFIEECVQFPILKSRPPNAMLAATSSEFEGTHQQKATTSRSRSRVQTSPAPVQFPASLYFATRAGRIGFSRMTGGPVEWKSHGEKIPESKYIWMAFLGPDTPALGERMNVAPVTQDRIAATLEAFLGEDYAGDVPRAGKPIPDVLPGR